MWSLHSGSIESTNDSQINTVSHHNWGALFYRKPHFKLGNELQGHLTMEQIINWIQLCTCRTAERSHLGSIQNSFQNIFNQNSDLVLKNLTVFSSWRLWSWAHKASSQSETPFWQLKDKIEHGQYSTQIHTSQLSKYDNDPKTSGVVHPLHRTCSIVSRTLGLSLVIINGVQLRADISKGLQLLPSEWELHLYYPHKHRQYRQR